MSAETVRAARERVAALPKWKRDLYALEEKALNQRQRAVVAICENFTQWDLEVLAVLAVAYAEAEVRALLIDGSIS